MLGWGQYEERECVKWEMVGKRGGQQTAGGCVKRETVLVGRMCEEGYGVRRNTVLRGKLCEERDSVRSEST